jgi:predicted DNA binding CopG/RHH family protein
MHDDYFLKAETYSTQFENTIQSEKHSCDQSPLRFVYHVESNKLCEIIEPGNMKIFGKMRCQWEKQNKKITIRVKEENKGIG